MDAREFELPTRIVLGRGALARVPELVGERVFVVSDAGVVAAGHCERLERQLDAAGITWHRYDAVRSDPNEDDVAACLAAYRSASAAAPIGWIVALGGGSAIDVAKGSAMLACGGGRMADYVGRGRITVTSPRLLAIPTTAGTGSETQSFALIGNRDTGQKMACGGTAPAVTVLDPELTLTMPAAVTASTGLDTLTHAVEAFVSRRRTSWSAAFAREAFALAERNFERVLQSPDDLDAREAMLHASALAGVAIENGMLGAAHSMANPLTRHHGVAHGQAVGQALPAVVAFNAGEPTACAHYAELARARELADRDASDETAAHALATRLRVLVERAGFGPHIAGVPRAAADALADEAAAQWTAQFNPRPVDATAFRTLYREVLA